MPIVGDNRDFQLLAMAKKAGASAQVLARLERSVRELRADQRDNELPPTGIDNLLKGADFDHSVLSFTGSGSNSQAYPWFRGVNASNPVADSATNPLWIDADGLIEWSSTTDADDLSYRFDKRLIRPGQTLYLMFNARLKPGNSASAAPLQLEAGIWDLTGGIDNWITASLSGGPGLSTISVTKVGPGGATTTYTYVVVAVTDENEIIVSAPQSVTGAGALNSADFNRIGWTLTGGVLEYRVYRTTPNPGLVAIVAAGAGSFDDQGAPLLVPNAPIPQPSNSQARTRMNSIGLEIAVEWKTFRTGFRVPRSYNFSLTASTGQWLRMGLRGTSSAVIQVDQIGLSLAPGLWMPSFEDRLAARAVVITPTGDIQQTPSVPRDSQSVPLRRAPRELIVAPPLGA
jgi:hypothetical protein